MEWLNFFRGKLGIIVMKPFKILSTCLEINFKEEMERIFKGGYQALSIGFHSPYLQPNMVLGLAPHSDTTCLTALHQVNGVAGLQVKEGDV